MLFNVMKLIGGAEEEAGGGAFRSTQEFRKTSE
jgi:hypothetical protein